MLLGSGRNRERWHSTRYLAVLSAYFAVLRATSQFGTKSPARRGASRAWPADLRQGTFTGMGPETYNDGDF